MNNSILKYPLSSSSAEPLLSSSSLFHFTKRKEYLIEILNNGFIPRYTSEYHPCGNIPVAIQMKCFCDIPLGIVKRHMNRYGKFGVGISKLFAIENHISPVIYVHSNSKPLLNYRENIHDFDNFDNIDNDNIFPFFKKYDRIEVRGKKKKKEKYIRYYDEREWRYVPTNSRVYNLLNFSNLEREKYIK